MRHYCMSTSFLNKSMNRFNNSQGVAIYLSLFILTTVVAIAFGISSLFISEFEIARESGEFVSAIYAADTALEHSLWKLRVDRGSWPFECRTQDDCVVSGVLSNGATYVAIVLNSGFLWCPGTTPNICVRAFGTMNETNRAIEAKF